MPSTKDIEKFRKYLNQTFRDDFIENMKKEQSAFHKAEETTLEEPNETVSTNNFDSADIDQLRVDFPSEDMQPDLSTLIDSVNKDVDPNELHFDSKQTDSQEDPDLKTEVPTTEEADLSTFLDLDWTKDFPSDPVNGDGSDEEDWSLSNHEFSNTDSVETANVPEDNTDNLTNDSPLNLEDASETVSASDSDRSQPAGFFTSGSEDNETPVDIEWSENLFETPETPAADENGDSLSADEGVVDQSWTPTDLGEVPENFNFNSDEELPDDGASLDLGDLPQFAGDEEDSKATFEEKFGDTKKTSRKKKVHYTISDRDKEIIFDYLNEFPRNVKIACQRFIASDENDPEDIIRLIDLLKEEESIKIIVRFLEEKTGSHISIPRGFEKINGKAYWEKINSPSYIFRAKILPVILKATAVGLFALFAVAASVFLFIPAAHGSIVYRSGYGDIEAEMFDSSMEKFGRAFEIWPSRGWSYKYAEKYIEKRQYVLAEQIYDNLLADDYRPYDKKGRLDYCRFESEILGDYQKADMIIQPYLDYDRTDSDAHLEAADNFLRWSYFDESRLESARMAIVAAGENDKYTDAVLFRMLHYTILADRYDDVMDLWTKYRDKPRKKLDLPIFGKLAGYFIDREEKENANAVIKRMYRQDEDNMDAHFQWARLSRIESEWGAMENAANKVLYQLSQKPYLTRDTLSMKILSLNMKAIAEYKRSEYLLTQRDLEEGIGLYENAVRRNILKKEPQYGELYYHLGNLFYYTAEEYDSAFVHYEKAQDSLFHNSDIVYKMGYIEYRRGDFRSALLKFAEAAEAFSSNPNLLYATGNTFYRRNDYFSALAQYYHTADLLERQKDTIRGYDPENRIAHYRTVEGLSMIYNNIGAALYGIYRTVGDHSKYVQALAALQQSTEYRDLLLRNRSTMEGLNLEGSPSRVNSELLLTADNMKAALYPTSANSVQIYDDLPKDMETDIFGFY